MAARKVPVTSVTPASKVKATSKAQQSRTRNLVMGIAAATPVGRVVKTASTASKMAKTVDARRKFDAANERRILNNQGKKSVKVLPRSTAPKTDLSNRGVKPTRVERSERAADLSFKKAEGRYEGEYLTRMTGLRGPKGITSQSTRGQGTRSLRKEDAIKKEAKPVIKINTDPTKPKGIFGPLKNKAAAADTPANRAKAQANTRGLKAANKSLKRK